MPDPLQFAEYATSFLEAAQRDRKELPKELALILWDIVDNLAKDPDAYPERTRKMGRKEELLLYTHPDPPLEITYEVDRANRKLYVLHVVARVVDVKPVFVSYSHVDVEWLKRLQKFLNPLETQGLVRIWDDTKIQPGAEWLEEIRNYLASAKMAVLLVTQEFLNSDFIQKEEVSSLLAKAQQKGLKIFWIPVKYSTVKHSVLEKYQAAYDPEHPLEMLDEAHQNKAMVEICEKIRTALAS